MSTLRLFLHGLIFSAGGVAIAVAIVFLDLFLEHHGVGVFGFVAIWLGLGAASYTVAMKIALWRIKKPRLGAVERCGSTRWPRRRSASGTAATMSGAGTPAPLALPLVVHPASGAV